MGFLYREKKTGFGVRVFCLILTISSACITDQYGRQSACCTAQYGSFVIVLRVFFVAMAIGPETVKRCSTFRFRDFAASGVSITCLLHRTERARGERNLCDL